MQSILLIWMRGPHNAPNIAGLSNLIMHRYLRKGIMDRFMRVPKSKG